MYFCIAVITPRVLDTNLTVTELGPRTLLVAVDANPLEDIRVLENVAFVIKGGELIKGI